MLLTLNQFIDTLSIPSKVFLNLYVKHQENLLVFPQLQNESPYCLFFLLALSV